MLKNIMFGIIAVLVLLFGLETVAVVPDNALLAYNTVTMQYYNPLYLAETDNLNDFVLRRRDEIDSKSYRPYPEHVNHSLFMGESSRYLYELLGFKKQQPWREDGNWGVPYLSMLDMPGKTMEEAYFEIKVSASLAMDWWYSKLNDEERAEIESAITKETPGFANLDKNNDKEFDLWWDAITWYFLKNASEDYLKQMMSENTEEEHDEPAIDDELPLLDEAVETKSYVNPLANMYRDVR